MSSSRRTHVACGVDIGSTNVKVVLLDRDGSVLARARRPTPRDPQGLSMDALEVVALVEQLIVEACADAYEAHAVCTVGVGEDGVLLDADLAPLSPVLAWFDPRRQGVLRLLRPGLRADAPFDATDDAARTLVGWAWARRQPGAEAARSWTAVADLPGVLWTGRRFLSDTLASRTGAWRATTRSWSADRVAATLGSTDLLPVVLPAGEMVGELRSASLLASGAVVDGAAVVTGGHDHPVGGWAVDQLVPGAVLDSMGTAEVVIAQAPQPPPTHHPDVDVAPGIRSTGTTVLQVVELARNAAWAAQDPEVARWMDVMLAGTVEPEPVLEAGYFRAGRRGGDQPGYALDVPRDPRARASAVLGALACAGCASVETVAAAAAGRALDPSLVRLAGGWARSPGWLDIKATVTGHRSPPIAEPEVTAVGAALLAASTLGWAPDPAVALGEQPSAKPRVSSRRC